MTSEVQSYPVTIKGELTEPLSKWLWLLKWLLLIPHFIILAFLAVGFIMAWLISLFAILFTGSYPRSLFDFNVGVLQALERKVDYMKYYRRNFNNVDMATL